MAVFKGPDDRFWFSYRWEKNNKHRGLLCVDPITITEDGRVEAYGPSDFPLTVPDLANKTNDGSDTTVAEPKGSLP